MAKRYSGNTVVDVQWIDRPHGHLPHGGHYRCSISVRGKHLDTGIVGAPAYLTQAVDSSEAYDDTARAAIAFANHEGKLDSDDYTYDRELTEIHVGRSHQARWPSP